MRILFFLGHPAHYHLFKHTINNLKKNGNEIEIVIKTKDILQNLLDESNLNYTNLLPEGRKDGKLGILAGVLKKNAALYKHCKMVKPDIMVGDSVEITHIGKILNIPSMVFTEDDFKVVKEFGILSYPFANVILSPSECDNNYWNKKTTTYKGYHKLAYLHPNRFTPDKKIVEKYFSPDQTYFLIRLAKLNAHHDSGIDGLSDDLLNKVIKLLENSGRVYITSERKLPKAYEQYRLNINPLDIHHVMFFSNMFIGDSQSMAVESAMLGVPSIRFSSFTGKISVLEELEHKYGLTFGVHPNEPDLLLKTIEGLLKSEKSDFIKKRNKMLDDKIDVTDFFVWFIENWPESKQIMKENPDYQDRFR